VPEKIVEKIIEAPQITAEEYKKYSGKNVAIYKGKIIADGRTSSEAFKKALEKYPEAKTEDAEQTFFPNSNFFCEQDLKIIFEEASRKQ
jgi:hypothetical protein